MQGVGIIRIMALCVAAAMICSIVRLQRPELATAISLAAGLAVLGILALDYRAALPRIEGIWALFTQSDADIRSSMIRAVGIALLAELGAQLCADSGETALAGRIALASRLAILGLCLPLISGIVDALQTVLQ